jgi:hypothetical protein
MQDFFSGTGLEVSEAGDVMGSTVSLVSALPHTKISKPWNM